MIRKVKSIVKDRILTTAGAILILLGIGLLVYGAITEKDVISDARLIILFTFGGGLIVMPEKVLTYFINKK